MAIAMNSSHLSVSIWIPRRGRCCMGWYSQSSIFTFILFQRAVKNSKWILNRSKLCQLKRSMPGQLAAVGMKFFQVKTDFITSLIAKKSTNFWPPKNPNFSFSWLLFLFHGLIIDFSLSKCVVKRHHFRDLFPPSTGGGGLQTPKFLLFGEVFGKSAIIPILMVQIVFWLMAKISEGPIMNFQKESDRSLWKNE